METNCGSHGVSRQTHEKGTPSHALSTCCSSWQPGSISGLNVSTRHHPSEGASDVIYWWSQVDNLMRSVPLCLRSLQFYRYMPARRGGELIWTPIISRGCGATTRNNSTTNTWNYWRLTWLFNIFNSRWPIRQQYITENFYRSGILGVAKFKSPSSQKPSNRKLKSEESHIRHQEIGK